MMSFGHPLECAISAYERGGFPSHSSGVIASLANIDDLYGAVAPFSDALRISPVEESLETTVLSFLKRYETSPPTGMSLISFPVGSDRLDAVVVEGCEDAWFHGMRIDSDERHLILDWRLGLAEILAVFCHNTLCGLLDLLRGRDLLEVRGFLFVLSGSLPTTLSAKEFAADFGLRKRRYEGLINMFRAILAARGRYCGVPTRFRADVNLRRAEVIDSGSGHNPFLTAFCKVEITCLVKEDTFRGMCRDFQRMIDHNLVPTSPSDLLALRIRGLSQMNFRAAYQPLFRDVLVPFHESGYFTHEYGHAIDFCLGRPSDEGRFRKVLETYRESLVDFEAGCPYRREYLCRPSEVFARCYEMYCDSIVGCSSLLRSNLEPCAYPKSKELMAAIVQYFNNLLGNHEIG